MSSSLLYAFIDNAFGENSTNFNDYTCRNMTLKYRNSSTLTEAGEIFSSSYMWWDDLFHQNSVERRGFTRNRLCSLGL